MSYDSKETNINVSVAPDVNTSSINMTVEEAVNISISKGDISNITSIKLTKEQSNLIYTVTGYKADKLLWLFDVKSERIIAVDAVSGEVISIQKGSILSTIWDSMLDWLRSIKF